jgi:hypothetical protein
LIIEHIHIVGYCNKRSTGAHLFGFPIDVIRVLDHKVNFKDGILKQILQIIQIPFGHIFSDTFDCFLVVDPSAHDRGTTIFNKEIFIKMVSPVETPFQSLIESMTFQ